MSFKLVVFADRDFPYKTCYSRVCPAACPHWTLSYNQADVGLIVATVHPPEASLLTLLTAGLRPPLLHTPRHVVPLVPLLPPADGQPDHLPVHESVVVAVAAITELQLGMRVRHSGHDRVWYGECFLDVFHLVNDVLLLLHAAADEGGEVEVGGLTGTPGTQQGLEEKCWEDPGDRHQHHDECSYLNVSHHPGRQETEPGRQGGEGGHGDGAGHGGQAVPHTPRPLRPRAELVHDPVVKREVHWQPDGESDHHRLQDIELPAQHD